MSCEFCEGAGKALCRAELNGMVADVQIVNRKLVADLFRDCMEIEIKFCPMCGEPLTEPQPLTLDELRGMDGEPVWVEFYEDSYEDDEADVKITNPSCKVIGGIKPCANGLLNNIIEFTDGMHLNMLYYSSDWVAYRRPPKEATP